MGAFEGEEIVLTGKRLLAFITCRPVKVVFTRQNIRQVIDQDANQ
jgi:hypothetical protein